MKWLRIVYRYVKPENQLEFQSFPILDILPPNFDKIASANFFNDATEKKMHFLFFQKKIGQFSVQIKIKPRCNDPRQHCEPRCNRKKFACFILSEINWTVDSSVFK